MRSSHNKISAPEIIVPVDYQRVRGQNRGPNSHNSFYHCVSSKWLSTNALGAQNGKFTQYFAR